MNTDEQQVASNVARDATDDEDLARVRIVVERMRRGTATIRETRETVGIIEFLLRYIDRMNARWHAVFEDEVALRIRRRDEATRKRKLETQRRRRHEAMEADGGAVAASGASIRSVVSADSDEPTEAGEGGEIEDGGSGAVSSGRDVSDAATARERAEIRGGM